MTRFALFCAALLSALPLYARREPVVCGTHDLKARQEFDLHRQAVRSGTKRARAFAAAAVRPDVGDIAVIDDSDGVIARRNVFNLNQRTLRFRPESASAGSYSYELSGDTYDSSAVNSGGAVSLGDDDTKQFSLPFAFPFFGKSYTDFFINSDGTVSFGGGDSNVTDRSLGRFLAGFPRIAGLLEDLDPTQVRAGGGVFVNVTGSRAVITWQQVPEFSDYGAGRKQTFQIRFFADGTIEIAWSDVVVSEAVVGLSAGRLQGDPALVSFLNTPSGSYRSSIAEFFTSTESVDVFAAAQRFYRNHQDAYDYLVFYNNLGVAAEPGVVAYEVTVRNDRSGYGDKQLDIGADTGSNRRLQAVMNMGSLADYPTDVDGQVEARQPSPDTPKSILAHEAGHLFLAYASVKDENGAQPMLGYQSAHWSPTFNSEASLMEGERIRDDGPFASPRFLTTAAVQGFAPLDQYLMGFIAPDQVPDTFYVASASAGAPRSLPTVGVRFDGQRRNVSVSDVIAAVGPRVPDHTVSQRRFRFAFVLINASGAEVPSADIQRLEQYRRALENFYSAATSQRAVADTSLKRSVAVSAWPAVGVIVGSGAQVRVSVETAVAADLGFAVRASTGSAAPATPRVTIPAGSTQTTFVLQGVRAGAETLTLEPADTRYETVELKIGVTAAGGQRLAVLSGDQQPAVAGVALPAPIRVRLTDANNLPYPGVSLNVAVTGGGSVDAASRTTDESGTAEFRWTPGSDPGQALTVSAAGVPAVTINAVGRPAFSQAGVVNAASYAGGLVPGSIATIFGTNLGQGSSDDFQILLNGLPAGPIFYADAGQVNFLVPNTVAPGTMAEVVIGNASGRSSTVLVPVLESQPGIFFDAASGYGAVLVANTGQPTQLRPAQRGEAVEIYLTGLGSSKNTPEVLIGGVPAEVLFSGPAPGFAGLYQVNARVPEGAQTGTQTLVITAGGQRSNEVRIEVR